MIKFSPTVPIRFYAKKTGDYIPGVGADIGWEDIGKLFCSWVQAYGERLSEAQAIGINNSATVRTFYHPKIYEKLRTVQVIIIKNDDPTAIKNGIPDSGNPNTYEIWSGVENTKEENSYMEFRVRRYESK